MKLQTLEAPARQYAVVYADPAWEYKVWSRDTGAGRSAEAHYTTTSFDAMAALPVANVAQRNTF